MTGSDASVGILFVNRTDSLCHGGDDDDTCGGRARTAQSPPGPAGRAGRAWALAVDVDGGAPERDRAGDGSLRCGGGGPSGDVQRHFDRAAAMHQVFFFKVRSAPVLVALPVHEALAV